MELDNLLSALEERASTARTIFMLLDSDADGLVAVEQVTCRRCRHAVERILLSPLPAKQPLCLRRRPRAASGGA